MHQKLRGKIAFSDFRVLDFWPLFLGGFVHRRRIILKICATLSGWPKTGKKQGFFLFVSWQIFGGGVFHVVSLCSCFSSCIFFVANVWFVLAVLLVPFVFFCFPLCFFFGGGVHLFYINHFNGPAPLTKKQDQTTENPNIWNFAYDVLLWGLHPHTFTWPHNKCNPKPWKSYLFTLY